MSHIQTIERKMKPEDFIDWLHSIEMDLPYIGKRPVKICIMFDLHGDGKCPCELTKREVIDLLNQSISGGN